MTLTRHRTVQYVGILLALVTIAAGYWYFSVRAGVKTNSGAVQPQGTGDLSAGLVGYWKLDENTGTSAGDASTNGATGTLENGPTWTTGRIGSAVQFDGTNDNVDVASFTTLGTSTATLSLSLWMKTNDSVSAEMVGLNAAIWCRMGGLSTGKASCTLSGDDADGVVATTATDDDAWHHIAYVVLPNDTQYLYVDGALEDTATQDIGAPSIATFSIGTRPFGGYYNGALDEVRVYDRPLSADEVAQLYRLTTPTGVDTSLKGYWSFNGDTVSGTTAYDRSGAGNHGTLTNGPAAVPGRVGQALNFDGTNDFVTVGDASALDAGDTSDMTITGWFSRDSYASADTVFAKRAGFDPTDVGYVADISATTDRIVFEISDGTDEYRLASTALFTDATWHHFAIVWDQDSAANSEIYIDGVADNAEDTGTIGNVGDLSNAELFQIAAQSDDSGPFDGRLDEMRIYNRVLSATEIKSLYDRSAPDKTNTSAAQAQGTGRLDSGLAGYWKMDDGSGTTPADASANGNNGTFGDTPSWTSGQIGGALDFDGSNDYVSYANNIAFDSNDFAISAWVMRDGTGGGPDGYNIIFSQRADGVGDGQADNGLLINTSHQASFFIRDNVGAGVTIAGSATLSTGTWYHLVGVKTSSTIYLYVNGVLAGTATHSLSGDFDSGVTHRYIGKERYSGADGSFFNGKIDEVRVYQRALSPDEIANLYRLTTPTGVDTSLKGYWSFNGSDLSSTTAYDRSGVGNHGTLTGGPPVVEGRVGQALSFDNVNDYVLAGSPVAVDDLETQGGGGLTASAWIYPESGGTFGGTIVGKRSSPGPGDGDWAFTIHEDGDAIKFYKSYSTTVLEAVTPSGSIALNKWQFVTATWSGSATRSSVVFYIDGVLVPTSTSGGSNGVGTKDSDASNVVSISSQFLQFDGLIDEVRLHNRILSAAEVKSLYDLSAPDKTNSSVSTPQGTGRLDSGLAGYWKLDENTGTSATDSSTNAITAGTLTNGPTWTTGQIGSGVDFDGSNDSILVADNSVFKPTDTTTAAVWFNADSLSNNNYPAIMGHANAGGWVMEIDHAGNDCSVTAVNALCFYIRIGGANRNVGSTMVLTTGTWYHAVATYDGSAIRLYLNGVLIGATAQTGTIDQGSNPFYIGADYDGNQGQAEFNFDGKIDDVRIYNRALSADEAAQLYRLTAPTGTDTSLKGYWSFNGQDMTATMASDRSGAGNDGTLTNSPTITEGKLGQALSFDGTNDYVDAGSASGLDDLATLTATGWFNQSSCVSGYCQIIGKGYGVSTPVSGWKVVSDVAGGGQKTIGFLVEFSGTNLLVQSSTTFSESQWNHFSVTWDGSTNASNVHIYLNGTEVAYQTQTNATGSYTSDATETLDIGGWAGGSEAIAGKLDEIRLYSRILSASEIKALYSSGK